MDYVHQISEAEAGKIQRFLYVMLGVTLSFIALVGVAFATADTWLLWISPESEQRFIDPYIELAEDNVLESGNAELQSYVESLARKIAAQMEVQEEIRLSFHVIKGNSVNAFTTLGGYVFVTESIVAALDSENSLAMVLAHEIAHAKQRDPLLGAGRGMLIGLLMTVLSGSGGSPVVIGDVGSQLVLNIYSREQEQAADRSALTALHGVYGHVGGATNLFEVLGDQNDSAATLEALSTHPQMQGRIESLQLMAAEQSWPQSAVELYPAHILGVIKKL